MDPTRRAQLLATIERRRAELTEMRKRKVDFDRDFDRDLASLERLLHDMERIYADIVADRHPLEYDFS
jgi:hypothetical protein